MKKAALINLGCTKNLVDGESIAAFMAASGFELTTETETAQVVIVNTCTFIKEATEEAISSIVEAAALKKNGVCETLVVSGCFSQRYRSEVQKDMPEVDLWVGVDEWRTELAGFLKSSASVKSRRVLTEPRHTQYLKISEGCSHRCTYCIIPSIRGDFRSRTIADCLEEAQWLYAEGARELIVVSQDTSFYGRDIGTTLSELLLGLLDKTEFPWIRMMYLHPQFVDNELLKVVADNPRICPYFDMPLQHISNGILTEMKRKPLSAGTRETIEKIRTQLPDAAIRTSFISGFPGEKPRDHAELLAFVEWARFDRMGVFPFSPEEGTPAAEMKGRPRTATVENRCEELMELQKAISGEIAESRVGKKLSVIIDRVSDDPDYSYEARTRYDAPEVDGRVFLVDGEFDIGQIVTVEIVECNDYDLFARSL